MRKPITTTTGAAGLGLLILLAACRLGDLIEAPPSGLFAISPERVNESATIGSTTRLERPLTVDHAGTAPIQWTATSAQRSGWLSLDVTSGTTPRQVMLRLDPAGLDTGTHRDTILFATEDPRPETTRLPVSFRIQLCSATPLALDADVSEPLTEADCPALHRPAGHFARLYRFNGVAGDTVSIFVGSTLFDADVLLDTSLAPDAPPLADAQGCGGAADDACIRLHTLPQGGTYFIEVTSAAPGDTGAFVLQATRPRTPRPPSGLGQLKSDRTTRLDVGATTDEAGVALRALVSDRDTMDALALEVEVRAVGTAFTGEPTGTAGAARSGDSVVVPLEGLADNTGYHWRVRTADASGRRSPWVSFGANAETTPDFTVSVPAARLEFTVQPQKATAGQPITPAVEVTARDAGGRTAASFTGLVTIELVPPPTGGTLSGDREVNAVAGVARFADLSVDRPGVGYRLRAATQGLEPVTSDTFTVLPLGTGRVAFAGEPGDAQAGEPIPNVRVGIRDAAGNLDPTFVGAVTVDLAAHPSGATLAGDRSVDAVAGMATFPDLSVNRAGTGFTLIASAQGMTSDTSAPFDITEPPPTPATQLLFSQQPSNAETGAVIAPPVTVTALDALGRPVPTFAGTVTLGIAGGGTLGGRTSAAAVGGVATFDDLSIATPGTYRLTATAAELTPATSESFVISEPPPVATALRFAQQPTDAEAGEPIAPPVAVEAVDDGGTRVTSFSGSITIAIAGGATLASANAVSGVATYSDLVIETPGTYRLTATATRLTSVTSDEFDITAPPPQTGSLTVTTTTSGPDEDPNGYTVTVAGTSRAIGVRDTETFTSLAPGNVSVALTGVASNCEVSGQNPRTVPVTAGSTAQTTFTITCTALPPPTGSLTVTTTTTGTNPDDGYTVTVDGGQSRNIGANASTTYTGLAAGSHEVQLSGVASNCDVAGQNPRTVNVPAGGTQSVGFTIDCSGPPNRLPVVNAGPDRTVLVAFGFTLEASFSDPDGNGDGPWSYEFDWDQGSPSRGTTASQGTIRASHTYLLPGRYTIRVTVSDRRGGTGSDSMVLTVAAQ